MFLKQISELNQNIFFVVGSDMSFKDDPLFVKYSNEGSKKDLLVSANKYANIYLMNLEKFVLEHVYFFSLSDRLLKLYFHSKCDKLFIAIEDSPAYVYRLIEVSPIIYGVFKNFCKNSKLYQHSIGPYTDAIASMMASLVGVNPDSSVKYVIHDVLLTYYGKLLKLDKSYLNSLIGKKYNIDVDKIDLKQVQNIKNFTELMNFIASYLNTSLDNMKYVMISKYGYDFLMALEEPAYFYAYIIYDNVKSTIWKRSIGNQNLYNSIIRFIKTLA